MEPIARNKICLTINLTMLDVHNLVQAGSLVVIALVIFAESGLLLGVLFPGDTLLIAGGIFAAQHRLPLGLLIFSVAIATILGYQVGYYLGRSAGPRIFKRKDGILFRAEYMSSTERFFARHGWEAILFARFIAIVRTVTPVVAGMGKMPLKMFVLFNVLGGLLWSAGLILISYWVGQRVPNLDAYIKYLVLIAIVLTFGSVFYELARNGRKRREIFGALREEFKFIFKKK
jgi:membrane-associated protein